MNPEASDADENGILHPREPVEICSSCHQPLIRRGADGECLRCLFNFAWEADDADRPAAGGLAPVDPAWGEGGARRYGHFEIAADGDGTLQELGSGAMGVTYRARDTVLGSTVALKVIAHRYASQPDTRARFLREARAAARLRHPNVATVFHYGEREGECFYAMELVEGETLEQKVRRDGPLSPALALEVGVQVARALAAAEGCGVVHRDLKPSNIMLVSGQAERDGANAFTVKVIDYGLAKGVSAETALGLDHTRGAFVGTPGFASPEQFAPRDDERIDLRSDIYSLGITLWYLLCGRTPFSGRTLTEIHEKQLQQPLPVEQLAAAHVPKPLLAAISSMLQADPGARPQSARELLDTLRRCQERMPGTFWRNPRQARPARVAVLSALLLATAIGTPAWWFHARATRAAAIEKSVAVLPFENLSPEKADSFFTGGVQDENLRIVQVFGPAALAVSPRIGHVHVTVDDLPWHWADASGEAIIITRLPAEAHKVLIELVNANHQTLDQGVVHFVIPVTN